MLLFLRAVSASSGWPLGSRVWVEFCCYGVGVLEFHVLLGERLQERNRSVSSFFREQIRRAVHVLALCLEQLPIVLPVRACVETQRFGNPHCNCRPTKRHGYCLLGSSFQFLPCITNSSIADAVTRMVGGSFFQAIFRFSST